LANFFRQSHENHEPHLLIFLWESDSALTENGADFTGQGALGAVFRPVH
jgi:hypothetical protein